jgi:hypothetical protein
VTVAQSTGGSPSVAPRLMTSMAPSLLVAETRAQRAWRMRRPAMSEVIAPVARSRSRQRGILRAR